MRRFLFLACCLLLTSLSLFGTHNRAGEITFEQIGNRTILATITTYTKISAQIDRDSIPIKWGDGSSENVGIQPGYPLVFTDGNDIQKSVYIIEHTYPGPGSYYVSFEDPFRNSGINNIAKSDEVPMTLQSLVKISPFLGNNNSPQLLNPPIDEACVGRVYEHNPGAFDQDGDSLHYSLTIPLGTDKTPIESYFLPQGVTVHPTEGTLSWDRPEVAGEYNFAILIEEFRNGFKIGEVVRDMQVTVETCNNQPPIIDALETYCVIAGDTLEFQIFATDADSNDIITLSASGGPLTEVVDPKANFPNGVSATDTVSGTFQWTTTCDHIRINEYQITFRAQDNNPQAQLVDLHTISIKVIPPPPTLRVESNDQNGVQLSWSPSICDNVSQYEIYRKQDTVLNNIDSCTNGMPNDWGYTLLDNNVQDTLFADTPDPGNEYCYRVVAVHSDGSKSIVSNRVCASPPIITPLIILNSVTNTSVSNGEIKLAWRMPIDIGLLGDTAGWSYQIIDDNSSIIGSTNSLSDTTLTLNNLNTVDENLSASVQILDNNGAIVDISSRASSVFASANPGNQNVSLSWDHNPVPWTNYLYEISIDFGGAFLPIDTIPLQSISILNLVNDDEYCFRIRSIGSYSDPRVNDSILNFSQVVCATPRDTTPPCLPNFRASTECETGEITLTWNYINDSCDADWASTSVFHKPTIDGNYELIETVTIRSQEGIVLENQEEIVGCYGIQVADTAGNTTSIALDTCIEHCAIIKMPNVFTPGSNGFNDLLNPVVIRQVTSLETTIYNRWGRVVHTSNELQVNWDGTIQSTGAPASNDVYFFVCTAQVNALSGPIELVYNGYVHLIRD